MKRLTRHIFGTFPFSALVLACLIGGIVQTATAQDQEKIRSWRHEGLTIDHRDVAAATGHRQEEPWMSAWNQLPKAGLDESLKDAPLETLETIVLSDGVKFALLSDSTTYSRLLHSMTRLRRALERQSSSPPSTALLRALTNYAIGVEYVRRSPSLEPSWLHAQQQLLEPWKTVSVPADAPLPVQAWLGALRLALGVVFEDESLYTQGEADGLRLLEGGFDDSSAPHGDFPLEARVQTVSALALMAEIENHHSDLFWGRDLYHDSLGPKNLFRIFSSTFEAVLQPGAVTESWGWLESAMKTFGEPAWETILAKHRPVFDPWCGGAVTLMHARPYLDDTPDFGEAEDGFTWLYNFKDTQCWQYSSRWYDIDTTDFYVQDGIFYTKGARDHWLMTDRMYSRFILRLEYKLGPGSNSGIMFWTPIPGRPSRTGFEVQLLDDAGKPINDSTSGALYKVIPPLVNAQKPAGEWCTMEITADWPRVKVRLNDQIVQDVQLDRNPATQNRRHRGYIGLQDHSHKVQFRNVRIYLLD